MMLRAKLNFEKERKTFSKQLMELINGNFVFNPLLARLCHSYTKNYSMQNQILITLLAILSIFFPLWKQWITSETYTRRERPRFVTEIDNNNNDSNSNCNI